VRRARATDKPRVYLGSSTLAGKQEGVAEAGVLLSERKEERFAKNDDEFIIIIIIITPSPQKK
jgi:hypothetical protein